MVIWDLHIACNKRVIFLEVCHNVYKVTENYINYTTILVYFNKNEICTLYLKCIALAIQTYIIK